MSRTENVLQYTPVSFNGISSVTVFLQLFPPSPLPLFQHFLFIGTFCAFLLVAQFSRLCFYKALVLESNEILNESANQAGVEITIVAADFLKQPL